MLEYANAIFVLLALAAGLGAWFSTFVLRAYRMTRAPSLLGFCLGFALLEVSFLFVLLNRLYGETRALYHGTLWVHLVIQTAGFGLIAATYNLKERETTAGRLVLFAVAYVIALAAGLGFYFALPTVTARDVRMMSDEYVYAIGFVLAAYALAKAARGTSIKAGGRALLVPAGFAALAAGQVSWVYWGLTDLDAAFLVAGISLPLGLALLTATAWRIWRER
jgi:hypothetical protein